MADPGSELPRVVRRQAGTAAVEHRKLIILAEEHLRGWLEAEAEHRRGWQAVAMAAELRHTCLAEKRLPGLAVPTEAELPTRETEHLRKFAVPVLMAQLTVSDGTPLRAHPTLRIPSAALGMPAQRRQAARRSWTRGRLTPEARPRLARPEPTAPHRPTSLRRTAARRPPPAAWAPRPAHPRPGPYRRPRPRAGARTRRRRRAPAAATAAAGASRARRARGTTTTRRDTRRRRRDFGGGLFSLFRAGMDAWVNLLVHVGFGSALVSAFCCIIFSRAF